MDLTPGSANRLEICAGVPRTPTIGSTRSWTIWSPIARTAATSNMLGNWLNVTTASTGVIRGRRREHLPQQRIDRRADPLSANAGGGWQQQHGRRYDCRDHLRHTSRHSHVIAPPLGGWVGEAVGWYEPRRPRI